MRMNKNILYVGELSSNIKSGKDVANKHNYQILKEIFGEKCFVVELGTPNFKEKLLLYSGGLTHEIKNRVMESIIANNIDIVFLSTSAIGKIAQKIKKKFPHIIIVCFYHNIERHYAKEQIKVSGLRKFPTYLNLTYNEYLTSKFADHHIVLNQRDNDLLKQYYKLSASLIVPIVYEDSYKHDSSSSSDHQTRIALFVGTSFFPNIQGIEWFLREVQPHINDKLIIVGRGMDNYKEKFLRKNVEVYGFVEDLSSIYSCADYVILPIFSGGGMKTKTAEAFMHAKTVLGTKEAFEGYENIDDRFAIECNTAAEFIQNIEKISRRSEDSAFNLYARSYYLQHNSLQAVMSKWQEFFLSI